MRLTNKVKTMKALQIELTDIKNKFKDDRRTVIDIQEKTTIDEEDLIEDEDLVITITSEGNIKSVAASEYNVQKRGGKGRSATKTKEDEEIVDLFSVRSKDDLLFITNTGRCHVIKAYKITKTNMNSKGKNIVNYLNLDNGERPVSTIATNIADNQEATLVLVTKLGIIKRLQLSLLSKRGGVTKIAKLKENDEFVKGIIADSDDEVLLVSKKGMFVRFALNVVRPSGKSAIGVIGMKFKDETDSILTITTIKDDDHLVLVSEKGLGKRTKASEYKASKNKGGKGFIIYKSTERTGNLAACLAINHENLLITTANGSVIRLDSSLMSNLSRSATGSKLININADDSVVSVAKIVPNNDEEEIYEE
jgi:DNA gyrase subunit A